MKEIHIGENEAGQRLDKFLAKYMSRAPKSFFYKMMRKKNITLNGKKAAGSEMLREGDAVKLFLSDETIEKFSAPRVIHTGARLDILYEDAHTLFINKPVGMLSQKARPQDVSLAEHLVSWMLETGRITEEGLSAFRPAVCNRLDRNTSGIVAAGKTLFALQKLSEMFRDRSMEKYYICLVKGEIRENRRISGYLVKDQKTNKVTVTGREKPGASRILTEYRPLKTNGSHTLLEVHLITGKTHQIRAHLASEGHPLIGDHKYGDAKENAYFKKKYGLTAQMLHACRLKMPKTVEGMPELSGREITAEPPRIFTDICRDTGVM